MNEEKYVLCRNCEYYRGINFIIGTYNECKYINEDNRVIKDPINGPYYERLPCDHERRNEYLKCTYFKEREETLLFKLKKTFVKIIFGGDI